MDISKLYYQENVQKYLQNEYGTSQWIQVCGHIDLFGADAGFWCGFVAKDYIQNSIKDYSWDIAIQSGGPGFEVGGAETTYKSNLLDEGKEPLLFYREFYGVAANYIELSQEFILLNNLRYDRKYKSYFAMYENGEQEEAVKFLDNSSIKVKSKFLKKYASAKQLAIVLQFDIRTHLTGRLSDYGLEEFQDEVHQGSLHYSIYGGDYSIPEAVFSRILGKKVIYPESIEECGFWPFEKKKEYEDYIIGADRNGEPIIYTSNPDCLNNYFDANPAAPMYLTPVFFSRGVLQKYYDRPELYTVTDGRLSCKSLWGIELDNHHVDVVSVYLGDLGRDLPEEEQKHWKNFNILCDESLSATSFARDMLCFPAESGIVEHQFKRHYKQLNKLWQNSYGWALYNPLTGEDAYVFDQIRRPISDGQAEFDQLVLLLCKLIIDALNEKKLAEATG